MGRGDFFFFFSILRLLVSGYIRGLFVLPHAGLAEHIQPVPKEDKKGLLLVVMEWSIMEYGVSVPEFTVPKQPVRNSEPDRWLQGKIRSPGIPHSARDQSAGRDALDKWPGLSP